MGNQVGRSHFNVDQPKEQFHSKNTVPYHRHIRLLSTSPSFIPFISYITTLKHIHEVAIHHSKCHRGLALFPPLSLPRCAHNKV